MHVIHFIAVKAEDKENAFDIVKSELENEYKFADWSDWHVVGGGRWNSNGSQYEDDDTDVISYDLEPDKFNEAINQARKWKLESFQWSMKNFKPDELMNAANDFLENGGIHKNIDNKFSMNYFYVKNIADTLAGFYNSDSYFYDLNSHSANMDYMLEDPKGFFLVPVDFHH
jgi:hypothetical protein